MKSKCVPVQCTLYIHTYSVLQNANFQTLAKKIFFQNQMILIFNIIYRWEISWYFPIFEEFLRTLYLSMYSFDGYDMYRDKKFLKFLIVLYSWRVKSISDPLNNSHHQEKMLPFGKMKICNLMKIYNIFFERNYNDIANYNIVKEVTRLL